MRRFIQTRFGEPGGNCFETAIASILEDPTLTTGYWGHSLEGDDHWYNNCTRWLEKRGYSVTWWRSGEGGEPQGYAVAGGISPTGTHHAVVWKDGRVAHDPHPRNLGLASVDQWFLIYRPLGACSCKPDPLHPGWWYECMEHVGTHEQPARGPQ